MSKYDSLLSDLAKPRTVTPSEVAAGAAQRAQTSLFQRLRSAHGGPLAGRLSWLLVRAAQPDNNACDEALDALAAMPEKDVQLCLTAARGARDSLRDGRAAGFAGQIVATLERSLALRGNGAERAERAALGNEGKGATAFAVPPCNVSPVSSP